MKKNNKGFTLAELLIVVAIIAVLIAIIIPVFTKQLEKAREATDLSNLRGAYSEICVNVLTDGTTAYAVKLAQTEKDWQTADAATTLEALGTNKLNANSFAKGNVVYVYWEGDGVVFNSQIDIAAQTDKSGNVTKSGATYSGTAVAEGYKAYNY